MLALCCIIFICVEITKEMECQRTNTLSGKTGLAIVIVGLAVVIVGLALTSPLNFRSVVRVGKPTIGFVSPTRETW
jgi:hypothetical protein